jgi:hypothetical protein
MGGEKCVTLPATIPVFCVILNMGISRVDMGTLGPYGETLTEKKGSPRPGRETLRNGVGMSGVCCMN